MPGIVGQENTYDNPNFVGALFMATPTDTPFLSLIGGLTGGRQAQAPIFTWQGVDLRAAGQNVALEGANAPAPQERVRFPVQNVLQVHHEAIEVSYTRQAATGFIAGGTTVLGTNPVADEFAFQVGLMLPQVGRDIEFSFIQGSGSGALPPDNTTPRRTKGLLPAIVTNAVHNNPGSSTTLSAAAVAGATSLSTVGPVVAGQSLLIDTGGVQETRTAGVVTGAGPFAVAVAALSFAHAAGAAVGVSGGTGPATSSAAYVNYIDTVCQMAYDNGGLAEGDARTIMLGSAQKRNLTKAYKSLGSYFETSRMVAGQNLQTIENDFGTLNVMLNRYMPNDTVAVVSAEQCAPVFLEVPGKGFLFLEPLAKVGSSERGQIYGEVGLEYGNEKTHAKVDGLPLSVS